MTCQNQINELTVFWLAKKFAGDELDFIGQSEMIFFRILPEVSDPFSLGLTKRIAASGNEIENMDVQYQVKNRLYMPWTSKLVSVTFYTRLHEKVDRLFCHSQNFSDI